MKVPKWSRSRGNKGKEGDSKSKSESEESEENEPASDSDLEEASADRPLLQKRRRRASEMGAWLPQAVPSYVKIRSKDKAPPGSEDHQGHAHGPHDDSEVVKFVDNAFDDGTDPMASASDMGFGAGAYGGGAGGGLSAGGLAGSLPRYRDCLCCRFGVNLRRVAALVFVESESSGRFFGRAYTAAQLEEEAAKKQAAADSVGAAGPVDDKRRRKNRLKTTRGLLQACFFGAKGMMAGFSTALMYLMYTRVDKVAFVTSYARVSNEMRRFFFFMSTLAAVASLDSLIQAQKEKDEWFKRSRFSKLGAFVSTLTSFTVLLLTELAGIFDTRAAYRDNRDNSDWAQDAFDDPDSDFEEIYEAWEVYAILRFLFIVLLWIIACHEYYQQRRKEAENDMVQENLRDAYDGAVKFQNRLKGQNLNGMGVEELRQILATQRMGVAQVESMLEVLSLQQQPFQAQDDVALV